jgi:hypothetical protein
MLRAVTVPMPPLERVIMEGALERLRPRSPSLRFTQGALPWLGRVRLRVCVRFRQPQSRLSTVETDVLQTSSSKRYCIPSAFTL